MADEGDDMDTNNKDEGNKEPINRDVMKVSLFQPIMNSRSGL